MPRAATDAQIFKSKSFWSEPVIVAAVSGGSDSLALLLRARDEIAAQQSNARLVAVTVDHGLRAESAAEAEGVARLCAARGIEHRTVRWSGDKPESGVQAAARLARYRLLAGVTRALGGRLVLTGHTRDDQVETVRMRMQRGEGVGLAGIAPLTLFDDAIWFARPQLSARRAELRAWLTEREIGWIDDPSNADARFERVRVRNTLTGEPEAEAERLLALADQATAQRVDLGARAADMIGRHASVEAPGKLRIAPGLLDEASHDAAVYTLRILLAVVGGGAHLPDVARSREMFDRLAGMASGRFSLARAVVAKRKDGIFLRREQRRGGGDGGGNVVDPSAELPTHTGGVSFHSPWSTLLPVFDLEPARAVAELIGKTPPPALPWP